MNNKKPQQRSCVDHRICVSMYGVIKIHQNLLNDDKQHIDIISHLEYHDQILVFKVFMIFFRG